MLAATRGLNTGSNIKIAKLLVFNREAEKVGGFIMSYRLYLRIKMRRATVKEQIQWILFKSVEKFLLALRKEFGGGDKESVEVAKIRRIEQEG